MRFVGLKPAGHLLRAVHAECITDCEAVLAAIPYVEKGRPEILLFDDCLREKRPLHFYGRTDGTCPIAPEVLQWLIQNEPRGARCRLVPHYLHAKVIWWIGQGAYIGSANLTDRAWNQNFEAGLFLTDHELDEGGVSLRLREFFDQLEDGSFPLTQEEYERQRDLARKRSHAQNELYKLQAEFEKDHANLKDASSPITHRGSQTSLSQRRRNFVNEWNETLQLIRSIGVLVSSDEYRPDWIRPSVPTGVQCDQFLHAYYYQLVDPRSERNAYLRDYEKNKRNPDQALRSALQWWRDGSYPHGHEEETIYKQAPRFRENFSKTQILRLTEDEWVQTLAGSYAFGDHTTKMGNYALGLGIGPGSSAKIESHARMLYTTRSVSGRHTAPEVFKYMLWGDGEAADRIFECANNADYKIPHIGPNILGEIIGWVRPNDYPPRNSRTNKALTALGRHVRVI